MSFIGTVADLCSCFLAIFNVIIMIIGSVIMIKGGIYYFTAVEASSHFLDHLLGVDEFYRQVAMTYVLPGSVMIAVGVVGYRSSQKRVPYLVIYSGLLIAMIGAKIKSSTFSLSAYFNRITASKGEFGLFTGIVYPEYGMQVGTTWRIKRVAVVCTWLSFFKVSVQKYQEMWNPNASSYQMLRAKYRQ